MAFTIFYSWQSDTPNKTNRSFIEAALKKALAKVKESFEVQEALREEDIKFDKDTQDVPGTPPITDVIFDKISKCAIFVPDLTFVGKTGNDRLLPNPNVLIEYGYALKSLTTARIIPVMNTAFGNPTGNNMPFNMRHLRKPLTYHLTEDASDKGKRTIKESLIGDLADAIQQIIKNGILEKFITKPQPLEEESFTENPSTFLTRGEAFTIIGYGSSEKRIYLSNVERIFLRIIPSIQVPTINSKTAFDMVRSNDLIPMGGFGYTGSVDRGRNRFGAYTCRYINDKVTNLTQLFFSNQLWGIDTNCIERKSHEQHVNVDFGYFPSGAFENVFNETLANYLKFVSDILKLPLPLKFIAGATDVEGYRMAIPGTPILNFGGFDGRVHNKNITFEGKIEDYNKKPSEILRPFFNHVWEECGLVRPDVEYLK